MRPALLKKYYGLNTTLLFATYLIWQLQILYYGVTHCVVDACTCFHHFGHQENETNFAFWSMLVIPGHTLHHVLKSFSLPGLDTSYWLVAQPSLHYFWNYCERWSVTFGQPHITWYHHASFSCNKSTLEPRRYWIQFFPPYEVIALLRCSQRNPTAQCQQTLSIGGSFQSTWSGCPCCTPRYAQVGFNSTSVQVCNK